MPNWCSGNIRFRGDIENIVKMLEEYIVVCGGKVTEANKDGSGAKWEIVETPVKVDWDNYKIDIHPIEEETDQRGWLWFKGTQRAFPGDELYLSGNVFYRLDGDEAIVLLDDFKQAWSIEAADFVEMSAKYHVDIRIFGWECGVEFAQEIEIIDGKVTVDKTIEYQNWLWECPLPMMGG